MSTSFGSTFSSLMTGQINMPKLEYFQCLLFPNSDRNTVFGHYCCDVTALEMETNRLSENKASGILELMSP